MKFKANTRRRALEYEKDWVNRWKADKTFEKSVENRQKNNQWVFYDGPPFLTGTPHHGHLLVSTVKDAMGRFHTMKGQRVERTWGWDCHGLPAEVYVEKALGIKDKTEIGTTISIADYVRECRAAMVKTGTEWEDTIERLGRWVEFQGAYQTMDKEYMESVWWAFAELYNKGKIYEGEKVLVYCTKDATPISKSEVAMENSYQMDTDPSVYVKFKLKSEPRAMGDEKGDESKPLYMLAWTTTPWTLPANTALAVNPDLEYEEFTLDGDRVIIAQETAVAFAAKFTKEGYEYGKNPKLVRCFRGSDLVGLEYEPLLGADRGEGAHKVWAAPYVSHEDGTGIVHLAPAYGEEDFELARENKIPIVHTIDENGFFTESDWKGKNVWEINKQIAKDLHERGIVWKIDYIRHEYPHCHRCGTKLMYRAHPSWFMDIQGQKDDMLRANAATHWVPDNLRTGRFHNIIEQAPDWNLSRDRYWATPIPVWKGERADGAEVVKVFGSYDEFAEFTEKKLDDYHLPEVMNVTFELDGTTMHHIGKVLDCWFESGSMPFAQFHYPFENKAKFESMYPADFIIEAIDQTRGWFYSLMAVNVGLFGKAPWKNLICTGFINAADGKKMSKKLGNYTPPMELMDKVSTDSFRFLMLASPLTNGENFALDDKYVVDVARKISMIWNMYDFFTMYAEVDGWEYNGQLADPLDELTNSLDVWVVSRLHQLVSEVEERTEAYDLQGALKPILPFIDDASNWFVRRSRRRFWKSEDDDDKAMAYRTLHYVLARLAYVLAPFTPFLAEELYHNLTGDDESIHLKDWLPAGRVDELVMNDMETVRGYVNEALSLRAKAGLKVRQPLSSVTVPSLGEHVDFTSILTDEVNVKAVKTGDAVKIDETLTPELKREGLMREVIRYVQAARKNAGLNVDDRIKISLKTTDEQLAKAVYEFRDTIAQEVLSVDEMGTSGKYAYTTRVAIDGVDLEISLEKV